MATRSAPGSGLRSPAPSDVGGGVAQLLPSSTPIAGALLAAVGCVVGATGAVSTGLVGVVGVSVAAGVAVGPSEAPGEALVHELIGLRASFTAQSQSHV